MAWKNTWKYMSGNVQVTVSAIDHNEQTQTFTFTCFISNDISYYDRLDNLSDVAHYMALFRNYYHGEIIDVKELKQ